MHRESDNIERAGLVAAVEQAADAIVITDADGKIQYVNPAFSAMTGYTGQEAIGQNPRLLKSGQQSAAFYGEMWNTIRSGQVWRGEVINRRKNGTLYHEEMQITPVQGANEEISSYIAIKRDVTARRAAEEAQRFLVAIVESSEDGIAAYTPEGIILTWNRGAEAIFGYSAGGSNREACIRAGGTAGPPGGFQQTGIAGEGDLPIRRCLPAQGWAEGSRSGYGFPYQKRGRRSGSDFRYPPRYLGAQEGRA